MGIHIHVAELQADVERSLALHDLTPVQLLEANGVLEVPVLAAHAVYLADFDRAILAANGATVVQCPTTHMKLGYGVTPVPALLADGVNVALGTDGAASSNALDMVREAHHAALIQKLAAVDAGALPGDLALRLATQNGARAVGFRVSGETRGRPCCRSDHVRLRHAAAATPP